MSDLESALRSAAKSGRLNYLSLSFTAKGTWEATYRGVADQDLRHVEHSDPASAIHSALIGRKIAEPKAEPKSKVRQQTAAQPSTSLSDLLA